MSINLIQLQLITLHFQYSYKLYIENTSLFKIFSILCKNKYKRLEGNTIQF